MRVRIRGHRAWGRERDSRDSRDSRDGRRGLSRAGARLAWAVGLGLVLGADAPAASAQTGNPPSARAGTAASAQARAPASGLPPLTREEPVGARRRGERVQEIPIAITAIARRELRRENLRRLPDIESRVPNLVFDSGTGLANTGRISLRGLAQNDDSSAADPVVGIYVDGVFRSRLQGNVFSLFDVEQIEVLRGPQGALFGKNTIGGAINVRTREPEFELGGYAEARVGNFGLLETRGVFNLPIVPEKAAVRFSLATATRDGYIDNVVTGRQEGDDKLLGGRIQFLGVPSDSFELKLSLEHTVENRVGFGGKCVLIGRGRGLPGDIANSPMIGFRQACTRSSRLSDLDVAGDVTFLEDRLKTFAASARATWDIGPSLTLTSISGWRRQKSEASTNFDATEVPLVQEMTDTGEDTQNQFSQELRLSGVWGENLSFAGGLFALAEQNDESEFFGLGFLPMLNAQGQVQQRLDGRAPNLRRSPALTRNRVKADSLSLAAYGQLSYRITEKLELSVGARLTKDRRRVNTDRRITSCGLRVAPLPGAVQDCLRLRGGPLPDAMGFTGFSRSGRFSDISPSASLSYRISETVLAYASYATAFQSGGFDPAAARPADAEELDNQEITSYEVGIKSSFFGDRLLLNANYFYQILSDGFRVPVPRVTADGNVQFSQQLDASALVRGGELELGWRPLSNLQLSAAIGVQRGEIEDASSLDNVGLSNRTLPSTPNYTMNFGLDYEKQLGRFGTIGVRGSWTHRGKQVTTVQAPRQLDVDKYGLLDGRIAYALPDGRTEIAAFGTNLLDRRYFNAGFSAQDTFGFGFRLFGPPRFYGVEVRRAF